MSKALHAVQGNVNATDRNTRKKSFHTLITREDRPTPIRKYILHG